MYITHLTLITGNITHIRSGDVSGETVARVGPWLRALVALGEKQQLPVSSLSDYTAQATVQQGALLCSVFAPSGLPLVTIGVALRSRQTADLWKAMTGKGMPVKPGLMPPPSPWCAALIWPELANDIDAAQWLGDFERCVAWAWLQKQ